MSRTLLAAACLVLGAAALFFWPVDVLVVHDEEGNPALCAVMPLGRSFETRYIHSVQLSPVEDVYFVNNGGIRQWQTKVQSQNAGLTSLVLPEGRFRFADPWLIFEGQAMALPEYVLRVGNETIGQNRIRLGNGEWLPLYPLFSGKRLYVGAFRQSLHGRFAEPERKAADTR